MYQALNYFVFGQTIDVTRWKRGNMHLFNNRYESTPVSWEERTN